MVNGVFQTVVYLLHRALLLLCHSKHLHHDASISTQVFNSEHGWVQSLPGKTKAQTSVNCLMLSDGGLWSPSALIVGPDL